MASRQKIGQALGGFSAGVAGRLPEFRQQLSDERKDALLKDAFTIQRMLQAGQVGEAQDLLLNRVESIDALGGDNSDTLRLLNKFNSGDIRGVFNDVSTVVEFGVTEGRLKALGGAGQGFAPTVSGVQFDPETGQAFVIITDRNTGETTRKDVEGAFGETPTQTTAREVEQVGREATVRATAGRASEIKKEIGERSRGAARSQVTLRQALEFAKTATQGLAGPAKTFLARAFPNIDVSDEASLDSALTTLALEELQKFKGPTTDFEFRVTQDIAGSLGDSKSANIARIKSLDRNNWFIKREGQQFNTWIDQGKRPDDFQFNFEEKLKTKQGFFTLQQLMVTAQKLHLTMPEVIRKLNR